MRLSIRPLPALAPLAVPLAALLAALLTAAPASAQQVDVAALAAAGRLHAVNRSVARLDSGGPGGAPGVRVDARDGAGVVWLDGPTLADGTIELDVRGRDVFQGSFLGVAFRGADDSTYDAVYLRPFNFRAADPTRRGHAVQYVAMPGYDFDRLRKERPEEFENPVEPAPEPAAWVHLRVELRGRRLRVWVGDGDAPDLDVTTLRDPAGGRVGLWVGNTSPGDFANVRIAPIR